MELFYQLSDCLSAYHQATDISIILMDGTDKVVNVFGKENGYCVLFKEACNKYCPCKETHAHACKEAANLGEGYIFSCPAGYIHFAVSLNMRSVPVAGIIAGPIALEYPDLDMIDEVIQKYNIALDYRTKLYSAYSSAPLVEPTRARYLCKLLFILASSVIHSDKESKEKISEKNKQQAKIGEYMQLIKSDTSIPSTPYELEKQLIEDVLKGNKEHAKSVVNEMLGRIYFSSGNNLEIIKTRSIELLALLSRAVVENGGSKEDVYHMTDTSLHKITTTRDLTDLSFLLLEVLEAFTNMAFTKYSMPNVPSLQKALKYIDQNYCNTITLEEVAQEADLNPAYLSHLFKKEMQINFSSYLLEKRMEQAKYLLKNTNMPLIDISMSLGFESQSYFTNVFKKQVGLTPKKYRYTL
ncbi:hypothetical protein CS063_14945 [Sporanaerobium hydrogeniformans]|uniref:Uncharacterized protein n=1 Tax=Sporanaerobium hydrogeniformans TaxID=3072179 RepID=A0AC61D968_9FIRM|nr:helix-turn-helix domain-containing protein [Sporanaerobium hydrogeniformans]PHV69603.1 hypothetical protein CS063_14945 [Sporanaerobium hydrogeniformans]